MNLPETPEELASELERRFQHALERHRDKFGRLTEAQVEGIKRKVVAELDESMSAYRREQGCVEALNTKTGVKTWIRPEQVTRTIRIRTGDEIKKP